MPIQKNMLDAMLNTFRNMAKDCQGKDAAGEAFDKMIAALQRMEELGQEMDDFSAYSAKITTEGLQMKFSTFYGQVLGELNKPSSKSDNGAYDDKALLNQALDAYRDAIKRLRQGKQEALDIARDDITKNEIEALDKNELLIKPIEEVIKLGESGINFPTFLRLMIEKGLDKAMEGSVATREALEYDLGWAKAMHVSKFHVAEKTEMLKKYTALTEVAPFEVPDSLEFELERKLIEYKYLPFIEKWEAIKRRWEQIIDNLDTWAIAHTRFAPYMEPWRMSKNPSESIQNDKDCIPGGIKVREKIFAEYFELKFHDIFTHETFINEVNNFFMDYSQVWIEFLVNKVYPEALPGKYLNKDLVKEAEDMHEKKFRFNPERHRALEKVEKYYDSVFGEGRYAKKAPPVEKNDSQAPPWDLTSFKENFKV